MLEKVKASEVESILKTYSKNQKKFTKDDKVNEEGIKKNTSNVELILKQEKTLRDKYFKLEYIDTEKNLKALKKLQENSLKQEKTLRDKYFKLEYDNAEKNFKNLKKLQLEHLNERTQKDELFYKKINNIVKKSIDYITKITSDINKPSRSKKETPEKSLLGGLSKKEKPEKSLLGGLSKKEKSSTSDILDDTYIMVDDYLRSINMSVVNIDEGRVESNELLDSINYNIESIHEQLLKVKPKDKPEYKPEDKDKSKDKEIKHSNNLLDKIKTGLAGLLKHAVPIAVIGYVGGKILKSIFEKMGKDHDEAMGVMKDQATETKKQTDVFKEMSDTSGLSTRDKQAASAEVNKNPELIAMKQKMQALQTINSKMGGGNIESQAAQGEAERLFFAKKNQLLSKEYKKTQEKSDVSVENKESTKRLGMKAMDEYGKSGKIIEDKERDRYINRKSTVGLLAEDVGKDIKTVGKIVKPLITVAKNVGGIVKAVANQGDASGVTEAPVERAFGSPFGKVEKINKKTVFVVGERGPEHALFIPDNKLNDKAYIKNAINSINDLSGKKLSFNESFKSIKDKIETKNSSLGPRESIDESTSSGLRTNTGKSIDDLHPKMNKAIRGALEEYKEKTGKLVQINSAKRSSVEQEKLYNAYKKNPRNNPMAAAPGKSMHEFGYAVDLNEGDKIAKMGIFENHGLTRPIPSEPWHVELAGIDKKAIRNKTSETNQGMENSKEMIGDPIVTPDFQMTKVGKQLKRIDIDNKQNKKLEEVLNKLSEYLNKSDKKLTSDNKTSKTTKPTPSANVPSTPSAGYEPMSNILPSATMMSIMFNFVESFSGGV